jgi:hypothetical protein
VPAGITKSLSVDVRLSAFPATLFSKLEIVRLGASEPGLQASVVSGVITGRAFSEAVEFSVAMRASSEHSPPP